MVWGGEVAFTEKAAQQLLQLRFVLEKSLGGGLHTSRLINQFPASHEPFVRFDDLCPRTERFCGTARKTLRLNDP